MNCSCRRWMMIPAALLMLGACTNLPFNRPPPQLFVLSPKSTFPETLPKAAWQLSVDIPIAEAGLNTPRIAVRRSTYELDYFEGVSWSDIAPRMVQTLIIESFENSGQIVGVGRQSVALRSNYSLVSELREFQAEFLKGDRPSVSVRLNVKLIRLPQRVIVAGTRSDAIVEAAGGKLHQIVQAFDTALGRVLKGVVLWTFEAAEKDYRDRR